MEQKTKAGPKYKKGVIPSYIAVIILLGVCLAVSVVYNFLGGFYYCRVIEYDKMLGEEQTIEITGEGAFACACNFSGSLVVGANINQIINVQSSNLDQPLYLRAKYKVNEFDFEPGFLFGYTNWIQGTDGYLYFNQPLTAYTKVGLCNEIKIGIQMELKSSTNYIMLFIVEASAQPWDFQAV